MSYGRRRWGICHTEGDQYMRFSSSACGLRGSDEVILQELHCCVNPVAEIPGSSPATASVAMPESFCMSILLEMNITIGGWVQYKGWRKLAGHKSTFALSSDSSWQSSLDQCHHIKAYSHASIFTYTQAFLLSPRLAIPASLLNPRA